jgi:metal-responsive CopG/Arc/MetJ family transcriptional regulator
MAVRMATNLSLPVDLVAEIDAVAGRRQRSAFVEEAVRKALRRERLRVAMQRTAGSLKAENYPHWATSEDVVAWVRELRAEETDAGPEDKRATAA